jgi:hypothetical protein
VGPGGPTTPGAPAGPIGPGSPCNRNVILKLFLVYYIFQANLGITGFLDFVHRPVF